MSCPICLEDVSASVTLSCGHTACQECLKQWFLVEETTGQPSATCPIETCRRPLSAPECYRILGGRDFIPAGSGKKKRSLSDRVAVIPDGRDGRKHKSPRLQTATDESTRAWLEANTIQCGGCEGYIMKESGCDKLQCICGFRICWKCRAVGANCSCNPGHGFWDNVTHDSSWGSAKAATREELSDMKSFLEGRRRAGQFRFSPLLAGGDPFQAFALDRQESLRLLDVHAHFSGFDALEPLSAFGPPPVPLFLNNNNRPPTPPPPPPPSPASLRRKSKIIQSIIQDDLSLAVEVYQKEMDEHGGSAPTWANELAFFLQRHDQDTVEALFPGVAC